MHAVKTKLMSFSAAHRLIKGYQGKCRNLHGHNYVVFVTLAAQTLDAHDFVVDFGDIKRHFEGWIRENWDHSTIISDLDQPLIDFVTNDQQKHYIIPDGKNTTVEVLCEYLYNQLKLLVTHHLDHAGTEVELIDVEIWETSSSCARFSEAG